MTMPSSHRPLRWLAAFLLILCALCGSSDAADPRPNFMIIIADDLCWRDLGYEGSPDVKTPNLDRLRSESMHLRGMFNPATSLPVPRPANDATREKQIPFRRIISKVTLQTTNSAP
jgi:hypothetical protein